MLLIERTPLAGLEFSLDFSDMDSDLLTHNSFALTSFFKSIFTINKIALKESSILMSHLEWFSKIIQI